MFGMFDVTGRGYITTEQFKQGMLNNIIVNLKKEKRKLKCILCSTCKLGACKC